MPSPYVQVVPVLLGNLPLKEDMEENETVYNCVQHLLSSKNPVVRCHTHRLARHTPTICYVH